MKRDMDLIRSILLKVEADCKPMSVTSFMSDDFKEHDWKTVRGHMQLLEDARYFYECEQALSGDKHSVWGITWAGHDFLDTVRNDEIWEMTKDRAKAAGGFTVELLGDLAKGFIKTQIKKQTGVEL